MSETATKQQIDEVRTWRADDKYIMRDGVQIGSFITAELAESAVRAVNAHEALVEALTGELTALRVWRHAIHPRSDVQEGIAISIDKIERALAAAR